MRYQLILVLVFLNSVLAFSQENFTKHTVSKGETISEIAEKYDVKVTDIYKLNHNAKNLLKLHSVLLIPVAHSKNTKIVSRTKANTPERTHEVLAKETLYGLSRQYGITVEELNQANPALGSKSLTIGQKIIIPANALPSTEIAVVSQARNDSSKKEIAVLSQATENTNQSAEENTREVLPHETKYSIAKQYGITIQEFNKANPKLGVKSLKVGQKITIPVNAGPTTETAVVPAPIVEQPNEEKAVVQQSRKEKLNAEVPEKQESIATVNTASQDIVREVLPKETKYGIAKQYGISVQELEKQNPAVTKNLPVGYKLNIHAPNANKEEVVIVKSEVNSTITNDNSLEDHNTIETTKAEIKTFVNMASRNTDFLDQLIEKASENIGTRYQTGGTSKSGFDCSGLMCNTFGAFDIKLPRSSIEQSGFGTKVEAEEAKKGDLIFFKTNGRNQINHVGMVVEVCDGEIKFIHASVGNGVIISSTRENYYKKKVVQVNRVL